MRHVLIVLGSMLVLGCATMSAQQKKETTTVTFQIFDTYDVDFWGRTGTVALVHSTKYAVPVEMVRELLLDAQAKGVMSPVDFIDAPAVIGTYVKQSVKRGKELPSNATIVFADKDFKYYDPCVTYDGMMQCGGNVPDVWTPDYYFAVYYRSK